MSRYALARKTDGLITNIIEWDGGPQWKPPDDAIAILSDTANVGDTWNGTDIVPGAPPPPTPEEVAWKAAVTQLRNTFNTPRTAAQINNSIDAITVILRRIISELRP